MDVSSKFTLLILAAGMATRYGSCKQLEPMGPCNATIMDYSIYDASLLGCTNVVIVIRESQQSQFIEWAARYSCTNIKINFAIQPMPSTRQKPWGTAHAVLCAQPFMATPFVIINADDFYGRQSFKLMFNFLQLQCNAQSFALAAFQLEQTLSPHGGVSRGICSVEQNKLVGITERKNIVKQNGIITTNDGMTTDVLHNNEVVSMNMWAFHTSVFEYLNTAFHNFSRRASPAEELYLPMVMEQLLVSAAIDIHVCYSPETWYGVTYANDKPAVVSMLSHCVNVHRYPYNLFA